jgi:hypothetical protein
MIWDQFFTFRPVATGCDCAFSWSSLLDTELPFGRSSFLGGNDWMAELSREQWLLSWDWLSWSIGSMSPLAASSTCGSGISFDTSLDKRNVVGEIHRSAEVMIWNLFFTVRPKATISNRAESSIGLAYTFSVVSCWGILVNLGWVAEFSSEQWSTLSWSWNWSSWYVLSMSPLASFIAVSNNLSRYTSLDEVNVGSEI